MIILSTWPMLHIHSNPQEVGKLGEVGDGKLGTKLGTQKLLFRLIAHEVGEVGDRELEKLEKLGTRSWEVGDTEVVGEVVGWLWEVGDTEVVGWLWESGKERRLGAPHAGVNRAEMGLRGSAAWAKSGV